MSRSSLNYLDVMKIYSWNVNGIRAIQKKGFVDWVLKESPDILCLQEIKASSEQLDDELLNISGYIGFWNPARRKGYSGVATYFKKEPLSIAYGIGVERFDSEGRIMISTHDDFILLNVYFPNGQMGDERLKFKLDFYEEIINYCDYLTDKGIKVVICGDFNTAHREIDLKNPKANENNSGFLPVEREMLDKFLSHGYVDVFRYCYPEQVQYTWWSYRTRARERDIGWRIDCFYASGNMLNDIQDCRHLNEVEGSDHCPLVIILK